MTKRTERFLNGLFFALMAGALVALAVMSTGCAGRFITESGYVAPSPPKVVEVEIFSLWDGLAVLTEEIGLLVTYQRPPSPALHDKALQLLEFAGALRDDGQYEPRPHVTDHDMQTHWVEVDERADEAFDELPEVTP